MGRKEQEERELDNPYAVATDLMKGLSDDTLWGLYKDIKRRGILYEDQDPDHDPMETIRSYLWDHYCNTITAMLNNMLGPDEVDKLSNKW